MVMMKFMWYMDKTQLRVGMPMIFFTDRMEMIGSYQKTMQVVIKETIFFMVEMVMIF